jgi:ribosomal protein S18 acetylase RimI-like enzyme
MAEDIVIRDAGPGDLWEIEALVKTAYREFQPLLAEYHWNRWMDNISQAIHSPGGQLIVAERRGRIVGVVQFYPDSGHSGLGHWPPGSGAIRLLAVEPGSRGQGLGTRLTEECLRRARELKIPTIFLYTGEFMRAARNIYERLGFQRTPEFDRETGPIAYRLDLS